MLGRVIVGVTSATLALALSATIVLAGNPSRTGQPSAGCGDPNAPVMPNGFNTAVFANADTHYCNPERNGGIA